MIFKLRKIGAIEGDAWRLWLTEYAKDVTQLQIAKGGTNEEQTFLLDRSEQPGSLHKLGADVVNRLVTLRGGPTERMAILKEGLLSLQGTLPAAVDPTNAAHLKGRYGGGQADVYLMAPEDTKGLTIRINLPDGRSFSIEIEARGAGAGQAILVTLLRRLVAKLAPGLQEGAIKVDDLMEGLEDVD